MGRIGLGLMIAALVLPTAARAAIEGNWVGGEGGLSASGRNPIWVRFTGRMILAHFGCVLFDGKYAVRGQTLQHLGDAIGTENGCDAAQLKDEAAMGAWRRDLQVLKTASGFQIASDRLTLSSPDGGDLVLVRQVEPPLAKRPLSLVSGMTHRRERAGQCFDTRVRRVENRLQEGEHGPFVKGSGSAVAMADGHYTVEYSQVQAMDRSQAGDRVHMCVRSLPRSCPPGDTRGIVYRVQDLTTGLHWTSSDSNIPAAGPKIGSEKNVGLSVR